MPSLLKTHRAVDVMMCATVAKLEREPPTMKSPFERYDQELPDLDWFR